MSFERVRQSKSQAPQTSWNTSQFTPRPFPVQEPKRPPTQEELENQAFQQDRFEATGLQLKEQYGTITPVEQERLGMLQAKMDSFWAQRMERAKAQPNLLEILIQNAQTSQTPEPATPVQPKLAIGEPDDQYEQEADQVAEQVMKMPAPPEDSQPQPSQNLVQRKPVIPGMQQPPGFAHLDLFSHAPQRRPLINPLQAKLAIGQPNDIYEQEADRVAEQVMTMAPPTPPNIQRQLEEIQPKSLAERITPIVQRQEEEATDEDSLQTKCETCEQEGQVQRSANEIVQAQPDLESRLNVSKGGGNLLPDEVRSFMEPRFKAEFSHVRVHTDGEAVQMNRELGAQAFTHRNHIYYGAGKAPAKDELTGHELTHVVQQTGKLQMQEADETLEAEELPTYRTYRRLDLQNPDDTSSRPASEGVIARRIREAQAAGHEIIRQSRGGGVRIYEVIPHHETLSRDETISPNGVSITVRNAVAEELTAIEAALSFVPSAHLQVFAQRRRSIVLTDWTGAPALSQRQYGGGANMRRARDGSNPRLSGFPEDNIGEPEGLRIEITHTAMASGEGDLTLLHEIGHVVFDANLIPRQVHRTYGSSRHIGDSEQPAYAYMSYIRGIALHPEDQRAFDRAFREQGISLPGQESEDEVTSPSEEDSSTTLEQEVSPSEDLTVQPVIQGFKLREDRNSRDSATATTQLASYPVEIQRFTEHQENILQRTPVSRAITPLLSHSLTDWVISDDDGRAVLRHLRGDPDLSATIGDLNSAGMLGTLITEVDNPSSRRELVQLLGTGLNASARSLVEPHIQNLGREWELQFNLGRMGVTSAAPGFSRTPYSSLVSSDPRDPFTGVGASGVNPSTLDIPYADQWGLWDVGGLGQRDPTTVAEYSNPLPGSLPPYLATLTPAERTQQAELLLNQPISSVMADSYAGDLPSRAQVMRAAATAYNLHPELVAAFILAEQRDQSRNEDAKDYVGATTGGGDTSIGLGQVVISTASRHDLFSDLLSSSTRSSLEHDDIALLLASDEFNIFAVAHYIRIVADDGAGRDIATLPNTQREFPGIDLAAYAGNSSSWSDDNIRVLGMYYTSRAWTDNVISAGWGNFVFEAYQDVCSSGIF
jgi:hypothetical protein